MGRCRRAFQNPLQADDARRLLADRRDWACALLAHQQSRDFPVHVVAWVEVSKGVHEAKVTKARNRLFQRGQQCGRVVSPVVTLGSSSLAGFFPVHGIPPTGSPYSTVGS